MDEQGLRRIAKRVPSRERIENMRRLALFVGNNEDGEFLSEMAELLMDLRQVMRGGAKELKGSRHWTERK